MHNRQRGSALLLVLLVVIVAGLIGLTGWHIWQSHNEKDVGSDNTLSQQHKTTVDSQEEAIKQAESYKPQANCTAVVTPAIHKATGAKYMFPSGCLPPGWEQEQTGEDLPAELYQTFRCDRKTKEFLSTDKYCHDYELYQQDHAAGKI